MRQMKKRISLESKKRSKNILKKLYVLCAFFVLSTVLYIVSSYAINEVKGAIESQYIEDGGNLVRAYSNAFQNIIAQANLSLDMYATNEVFSTGSTARIAAWLSSHISLHPQNLLDVFFCDREGMAFLDNGKKIDISDTPYYKEMMSGSYIYYLGTAVSSQLTGKMFIQVCRAIFSENDELRGFVGGTIELNQIKRLLSDARAANSPTPFILDENGVFISHVDSRYLMRTFKPGVEEFSKYTSEAVAKNNIPFFRTISVSGQPVHVFTQKINGTPCWTAGVTISDFDIYKTYNKLEKGKNIVFISLIVLILVLYFVFEISIFYIQKHRNATQKIDPLTGLFTRVYFEKQAADMMNDSEDGKFMLVESDFVGFKFINRNYGEQIGNKILVAFSQALKDVCTIYGGIAAHGFADHFYYFNQIHSLSKALSYMRSSIERIAGIAAHFEIPFTPKYGISFVTPKKSDNMNTGHKSIEQLIGETSLAKKKIKNNIETHYAIFTARMARQIQFEQKIEQNQERALASGEFFVMYQPKINLITDKIIGAEALVRWQSSEMGYLGPDKFIPLFESNGFIKKLDFAVYEMVFKFIKRLLDANEHCVPISINMSRSHVSAASFIKEFMERFEKYKIPPKYVEIELLERSVAGEKPILQEITNELHKRGFSVAMDDFGSGESSLNMLNSIPIDTLKFDQAFLRHNSDEIKSQTFITSLMRMAQNMKKKTVFEGVETEEQRDFLKSINCDCVQGYFYSKPLTEDNFIQFIKDHS